MRLRRHACSVIALALISAACSGPAGGGGDAAPTTTTPSTVTEGGLHGEAGPVPTVEDALVAVLDGTPVRSSTTRSGNRRTAPTTGDSSTPGAPTTMTSAAGPTTTVLPPEKCPEPKTCRRYGFVDGQPARWPVGSNGRVTVPYWVNPTNSGLPAEKVQGAIAAAFATWERAAPTARFVFQNFTDRIPIPGDGFNDIGFASYSAHALVQGNAKREITEADMYFAPNNQWTWAPCGQADGSCTPHDNRSVTGGYPYDLQSIATHEAGHWLWLRDMQDETLDRHLTMNPGNWNFPPGSRYWSTLALGDVLGVRALYPCSCPLPPIYDP